MAKEEKIKKNNKVIDVNITGEMQDSFISYAMSVITSRALPDVRDGLKPVHRRVLYSMHQNGLTHTAKFRKSARVVGDVMGKYHPHGDAAIYDTAVGMAQEWSYRYPLINGQGNFGSVDGDPPAAMRYTEMKMSKLSSELLRDIEKETVDFQPNFDDTAKEPKVLPSSIPNLLFNGVMGIAVGMATNIPPHNLREIIDACIATIDNPKISIDELMEYIQGPDFPLGGIVYSSKDLKEAYTTGRGSIVTRGEAEIVEGKDGKTQIIIKSIPYRVNKASLITKIADLVKDKKLQGIKALRDESTKELRIVIDLKSSSQPQRALNFIYKHTELEQNFGYNMIALVEGVPQTLGLKDILTDFISHRQEVVERRTKFDLEKAEAREHVLGGLNKAIDQIDAVIKTIKQSKDSGTAKLNLMKKFKFTEIQAQAILDMKLQKLAGLERQKIEEELKEIKKLIKSLKELLANKAKQLKVIKDELLAIKDKYGDDRRTKIVKRGVKEITDEDLIPSKESALVFTAGGYVKRTDPGEYKAQRRGGIGVIDIDTKEEDIVTHMITADTHSAIMFFSDSGKVYKMRMFDLPEGRRSTKGKSIKNFLSLGAEENITSILPIPKNTELKDKFLFFATRHGIVKKATADAFANVRSNGLIAIKLKEDDYLFGVRLVSKGDSVILVSNQGQSIRFAEKDVRNMGRAAAGVKGIRLKKGHEVVGFGVIPGTIDAKGIKLLVVSKNGFGKNSKIGEYKLQGRGGSGIKTMNVTEKTGEIVRSKITTPEYNELIVVSQKGQVIRISVNEIPTLGRSTQGVKIMKLRSGDAVSSITMI